MSMKACPQCQSRSMKKHDVLMHYLCSYVGPDYDFTSSGSQSICPKCTYVLDIHQKDWEVVGVVFRCEACSHEELE
jgi:DNA-directed RNA polymerase subunit RPC12/RpoP